MPEVHVSRLRQQRTCHTRECNGGERECHIDVREDREHGRPGHVDAPRSGGGPYDQGRDQYRRHYRQDLKEQTAKHLDWRDGGPVEDEETSESDTNGGEKGEF